MAENLPCAPEDVIQDDAGPRMAPLEQTGTHEISRDEFERDFGTSPQDWDSEYTPGYIIVDGQGAAPIYFDGEQIPILAFREPRRQFNNDEVYVFRWRNEIMLRRLRLISTNGGYSLVGVRCLDARVAPEVLEIGPNDDFAVLARPAKPVPADERIPVLRAEVA